MNLKQLKEIIDLVTSKDTIEELEIEKSGVRLRIKRASNHAVTGMPAPAVSVMAVPSAISGSPSVQAPSEAEEELFFIKSPIVGTFYKASGPTSEPFVSVGDVVVKGS